MTESDETHRVNESVCHREGCFERGMVLYETTLLICPHHAKELVPHERV